MENLIALVLAAGEGKRMKSNKSKVVHNICGKPIIKWVHESIEEAGIKDSIFIVGHKKEQVKECLGNEVSYATQEEQLGTGHAVMQAKEFLKGKDGHVIILCGDTPVISSQTISDTILFHKENKNSATVITAVFDDATGYGRIIRNKNGEVIKIVEHRDANEEEKKIKEVNSGMYCFNITDLLESLEELKNDNSQGEYYLTDTLEILISKGKPVGALTVGDNNEIMGINNRIQLMEASEILRNKIIKGHLLEGVTFINPSNTYIDKEVKIGMDTIIYPGSIIEGNSVIGENCIIGPDSRIVNSEINDFCEVNKSVILESSVGKKTKIGPFAYIRPGSRIGKDVKIGDFVEVKKSVIGDKTKISHLTYVGDAKVGKNVNLGCGVVFVNYDGKNKNEVVVGDNSFIGCNVNLIAPVKINNDSYIAAGSTITKEVPEKSLAIARSRQEIKEGWVEKKNQK